MSRHHPNSTVVPIGVGIDTARYGHHVTFLDAELQQAMPPRTFAESQQGYLELQQALEDLHRKHPHVHFQIHIDAAGQYAANLERFLRGLALPKTISFGEPARNSHYRKAHYPKGKSDPIDSKAMSRFAVLERPTPVAEVPEAFYQLREIAGRLEAQIRQHTRLVNQLHNLLSRVFPELALCVNDLASDHVLKLLRQYPTPEKIARARLSSLKAIPRLKPEMAEKIHAAAKQSVASFRGAAAEELIDELLDQLRNNDRSVERLENLLLTAYRALPPSGHLRVQSIVGIGEITAAVLVAKIVSIDRFQTVEDLVNYFGVFPELNTSGVDKYGRPVLPGTMQMSQKGNDLVRRYLWMAAQTASRFNPAVKALYARLRARGKRHNVALGHCMRKLLHLVYAVWTTDRPFDSQHFPWEEAGPGRKARQEETAAGHNRDMPEKQVVTAADSKVGGQLPAVNPPPPPVPLEPSPPIALTAAPHGLIDFAAIRQQVTMGQVLSQLGVLDELQSRGSQFRGRCPIHSAPGDQNRSFSANLEKNVFQCFHPDCAAKGNVLDLWGAVHRLPVKEAAEHLAMTFHLDIPRTEKRNPSPQLEKEPQPSKKDQTKNGRHHP